MIVIQQQGTKQAPGSLYVSSPFTISTLTAPAQATLTGGTLTVNGITVSTFPTTIHSTDILIISVTNPSTINFTTYAVLTIGTDNYVVSSTTITDPTHYHRTDSIGVGPLDYLVYPDGYTVYPYPASNQITVITPSNVKTSINISSYTSTHDTYPVTITGGIIFIANYTADDIMLVDTTLQTIVGRVSLAKGATPTYCTNNNASQTVIVSQTGLNSVAIIDRSYGTIDNVIPVGHRPMGCALDSFNNIWVANYGDGTVSVIAADYSSILTTITVGQGPMEIAADSNNNMWVTNSKDNTVSIINAGTLSVTTTIPVGTNPWGICKVGNFMYVANSYNDTINKIDITGLTIVKTITTDTVPYAIVAKSANSFYVACYDASTVQYFVNDVLQSDTSVPAIPFGVVMDSNHNIWIADYYSNLPARTYQKSQTPNYFSFLSIRNTGRSTTHSSNNITIAGLDEQSFASIPPISGTSLTKNEVNVGFSTTVVNGDILKVTVQTDNTYSNSTSTSLTIGNWSFKYTAQNEPLSMNTYDYHFITVTGAALSSTYTSNAVTIAGLSTDLTVSMTTSLGSIIKNGINIGASTTVQNGDSVQIRVTSSSSQNTPVTAYVQIGPITDMFGVITSGPSVFKGTFVPNYNLGTLLNQPDNILEHSNNVTISNLLDDGAVSPDIPVVFPTTITIDPFPGAAIIKNGVNVGTTVSVTDGDVIDLIGFSPLLDGYTRIINLYIGSYAFPWTIKTSPDLIPDPWIWQDIFYQIPGAYATSNQALTTGLTPGYTVSVNVPYGTLLVNGVASTTVKQGDLVSLQIRNKPPYSAFRTYGVSAGGLYSINPQIPSTGIVSTWGVECESLLHPVHWENTNLSPIPVIEIFQHRLESRTIALNPKPWILSHSTIQHSATTQLLPVHINISVKHDVLLSFERPSVPITREFGILAIRADTSVGRTIPLVFEHSLEKSTETISITPVVSHTTSSLFVTSTIRSYVTSSTFKTFPTASYVTSSVFGQPVQKSHVTSNVFHPNPVKSSLTAQEFVPSAVKSFHTVLEFVPSAVKSYVTSNLVTPQPTLSRVTVNSLTPQPTLSHVTSTMVVSYPIKSFSTASASQLLPMLSTVRGRTVLTQLIKNTQTSYVLFNSGPEYYDYIVYNGGPHVGTFATAALALENGIITGFTESQVSTLRLPSGDYIWVVSSTDCLGLPPLPPVPPPCTGPTCPPPQPPNVRAQPLYGWIQGG